MRAACAALPLLLASLGLAAPIEDSVSPDDSQAAASSSGAEEDAAAAGNLWAGDPRLKNPIVQKAREALAAGRLAECADQLHLAVEGDDSLPPPQLLLVYLYLADNRIAEGLVTLEQAAAQHRHHPEVYQLFGFIALAQQQNTHAWVHFEKALRLAPPKAWSNAQIDGFQISCYAGMADVAQRRGDKQAALEIFQQWIKLSPNDADLLERWGAVLFETGDLDAAMAKLRAANQIDPKKNLPELSLASLHLKNGQFSAATKLYETALEKYPSDPRAKFEYGAALLVMDQPDRAAEYMDEAVAAQDFVDERQGDVALFRGLIFRAQRKYEQAEVEFTKVLRLSPGHGQASQQLPLVLVEQSPDAKRQQALQIARFQAKSQPTSAAALSTLGIVQYRLGQFAEAEQSLRDAARLAPDGETLLYLARVYVDQGKKADARLAIESLKEAVDRPGFFLLRAEARQWLTTASLLVN